MRSRMRSRMGSMKSCLYQHGDGIVHRLIYEGMVISFLSGLTVGVDDIFGIFYRYLQQYRSFSLLD